MSEENEDLTIALKNIGDVCREIGEMVARGEGDSLKDKAVGLSRDCALGVKAVIEVLGLLVKRDEELRARDRGDVEEINREDIGEIVFGLVSEIFVFLDKLSSLVVSNNSAKEFWVYYDSFLF